MSAALLAGYDPRAPVPQRFGLSPAAQVQRRRDRRARFRFAREASWPGRVVTHEGETYGTFTVTGRAEGHQWILRCRCGHEIVVPLVALHNWSCRPMQPRRHRCP